MIRSSRTLLLASFVGVAALGVGAASLARPMSPKPATVTADDKAEEVLEKFANLYRDLKSMSADLSVKMKSSGMGMDVDIDSMHRVAAVRPNKFATNLVKGTEGISTISDGTSLYTYAHESNTYTKKDAPDSFDGILEAAPMTPSPAGMLELQIVIDLLGEDPLGDLLSMSTGTTYVGMEDLKGTPCHHVRVASPQVDMDLWFESGDRPYLRKFAPDFESMFERMGDMMPPEMKDAKMEMSVSFANWTNSVKDSNRFAFKPAEGAKEVESLFDMDMPGAGSPAEKPADATTLVGTEAPSFEADLLTGKTVSLTDHFGKDVIVLDFWATWCGPCKRALPVLDKVTKKLKNKGVVFYAVDIQEKDEKVQKFMDDKKYTFNVIMDRKADIARLYRVGPIPQTVIIGRDGTVEAVHIGLLPDLEQKLTKELETLLAGGHLHKHDDDKGHTHDHDGDRGHDHDHDHDDHDGR